MHCLVPRAAVISCVSTHSPMILWVLFSNFYHELFICMFAVPMITFPQVAVHEISSVQTELWEEVASF